MSKYNNVPKNRVKRSLNSSDLDDHVKLQRINSHQRSGKWTAEEESFANQLVLEFESGTLADCEEVRIYTYIYFQIFRLKHDYILTFFSKKIFIYIIFIINIFYINFRVVHCEHIWLEN